MGRERRGRLLVQQEAPSSHSFLECLPLAPESAAAKPGSQIVPRKAYEVKDSVGFDQLGLLQALGKGSRGDAPALASSVTEEVPVEERFAGLLLAQPYDAKRRLQTTFPGVFVDVLPAHDQGGLSIRIFRLAGPGNTVKAAREMLEDGIADVYRRHGIVNVEFEERLAARWHEKQQAESEIQEVCVSVDGEMEAIQVHKQKGPLWLQLDGSLRGFSRSGNGGCSWTETGSEWVGLGLTEKEVVLVTTARRQRRIKARWREMEEERAAAAAAAASA